VSYCQPSDLYSFGVPRGATPNPGRVLAALLDNVCTLDVHGFSTGDPIFFRPAGSGSLPAELSEGVTYYAESVSEHTFRVRATAGGAALTISDAEDPVVVASPLPISDAIAWASRIIDDHMPAHAMPIEDGATVPEIVRMTCAELAAGKLLAMTGSATASLSAVVDGALKRLDRWSKGVPLRDANAPERTNLAATAPATATTAHADRRGWSRYGGL
jgi:hypothetical protein